MQDDKRDCKKCGITKNLHEFVKDYMRITDKGKLRIDEHKICKQCRREMYQMRYGISRKPKPQFSNN